MENRRRTGKKGIMRKDRKSRQKFRRVRLMGIRWRRKRKKV